MILISHRGNINGRIPEKENHPQYIETTLVSGYDVEVDVWYVNGKLMLGHDKPQYEVNLIWFTHRINKLWVHCKNMESLIYFRDCGYDVNYFWHQTDDVIITSKGFLWAHPGKQPINNSIAVLPELYNDDTKECIGVCSDFILNPLSIYGKSKTEAEKIVLSRQNSTTFRFATAFGVSPRLRLDLLVNDLTYKSITEGYAVIYESHFMRTFIHVRDIANVFLFAIKNMEIMKNNVFNVGSDSMNFSKKEICELIKNKIPNTYFNYADVGEDEDKRNYIVNYNKIKNTGFETKISLEEGIDELIKAIPLIKLSNPYFNVLK